MTEYAGHDAPPVKGGGKMGVDVDALKQRCVDKEFIVHEYPGDTAGHSVVPWWVAMQLIDALRQQEGDLTDMAMKGDDLIIVAATLRAERDRLRCAIKAIKSQTVSNMDAQWLCRQALEPTKGSE